MDPEKPGKPIDIHEQFAQEVYGDSELSHFSSLGIKLRNGVRRFGAEENGIEWIPPEARVNQNPFGTFVNGYLRRSLYAFC